jgi:alpha-glucosidase (family GH31 glycosyl hydrolase)
VFDFTNAAAVKWWVGLNKPLSDMGLDFMKLDTSYGSGPYKLGYHSAAYQVTQQYAAANEPAAMMNGARGFVLAIGDGSANAPGNDQVPGMWTHDTSADFAGFGNDVSRAKGLNSAASAAYWGGDTGGYNNVPTDEVYVRWLEYSTFTPLQEFFGAKAPGIGARFPWLFGTGAQATALQYNQLRYRLLPFRYSNAQAAYHVTPVKYPVTWAGNTIVLGGEGDSAMLAQPIMTAGAAMTTVALPAGTWFQVNVGPDPLGPGVSLSPVGMGYMGSATVPTPLGQGAMFVKAGSIIPMGPVIQWVDQLPADPLTLDIYPSGATTYNLYEDDGISQGYLGGAYSTTKFSSDNTSGKEVVTIAAQTTPKYAYAGQICSRGYILKINGQAAAPAGVSRDGNTVSMSSASAFPMASEGWFYDATSKTVWVKFTLMSSATTTVKLM